MEHPKVIRLLALRHGGGFRASTHTFKHRGIPQILKHMLQMHNLKLVRKQDKVNQDSISTTLVRYTLLVHLPK